MASKNLQSKVLLFDVFGTCVDWRKTVTDTLWDSAKEALESSTSSISEQVRKTASGMSKEQWGDLAQEWRNSYLKFTRDVAADSSLAWKTVDQHHHDSLISILTTRGLLLPSQTTGSLWPHPKIEQLSLIWHYLAPWPDTVAGLHALNTHFQTSTLSNGNVSLLTDMATHARMPFTSIYSAEMFRSYKPNPKVYLGAAARAGVRPGECVMVAAHLGDLKAAKAVGFRTAYVWRPQEERDPGLAEEGFVDVEVGEGEEGGFVRLAEKLGDGSW